MRLPRKPSELIRLALSDLRKCEAAPDIKVNMNYWLVPIPGGCAVCLAGAVMRQSLGMIPQKGLTPSSCDLDVQDADALRALNEFRCGRVALGCRGLGVDSQLMLDRSVPEYEEDREAFHAAMQQLASDFEAEGN